MSEKKENIVLSDSSETENNSGETTKSVDLTKSEINNKKGNIKT